MANNSNQIIRVSISIAIIIVLVGIVMYPKVKTLFSSEEGPGSRGMGAGGQQPLFAS